MKKILFLLITINIIANKVQCQHLIITNNNDTISCKINSLTDGTYSYWKLTKPRGSKTIEKVDVKKIIADGDDTLYNIITSMPPTYNSADTTTSNLSTTSFVNEEKDNTTGGLLIRSGNNRIAAILIPVVAATLGVLIINNEKDYTSGLLIIGAGSLLGSIFEFISIDLLIKSGRKDKLEKEELRKLIEQKK